MSETPQPPDQENSGDTDVTTQDESTAIPEKVHSGWRTFGIVLITILVTVGVSYWVVSTYFFPKEFSPVQLSQKEKIQLDNKLEKLGIGVVSKNKQTKDLAPEPYSEVGASRDIYLSEKELNALLANNTNLAKQMVIDLSDDLASVKLLIDLDPDFPIVGGKTLKLTSGMELNFNRDNPRVILRGVSVWGVPLPDAWLGNMKNVDLLKEFGGRGGFWQTMKDGIEEMSLEEGRLHIKLKE